MKYAQVIVPVGVPGTFTYIIPEEMERTVQPFHRVVVPFGGKKLYTGIVESVTDTFSGGYELRPIVWSPDSCPIIRRSQLQLWEWMADYYMCPLGDVLRAALPAGLKIESETIVEINPEYEGTDTSINFRRKEFAAPYLLTSSPILAAISEKGSIPVRDLEKAGFKDAIEQLYPLIEAGVVMVREKLSERFRPKREEFYNITVDREDAEALTRAFGRIRSARHQQLFMKLLDLSNFTRLNTELKSVSQDAVRQLEYYDRAILRSLAKKGLIEICSRKVSRFRWNGQTVQPLPTLSDAQNIALKEIKSAFGETPVVLLHGVTSSGKTEIFMHLIDNVLGLGRQVLYLVPEIALTTQLTRRLQNVFGDKVVIYHSRFSDSERAEIWKSMLQSNKPILVVGARSSVFLPYANLGLVIVDEEHEQSYKQFDPAPRYNARDVATVLSRLHGAKTLLASATPAIETYYKAKEEKRYGLVTLTERFGGINLPDIEVIDMSTARKKGQVVHSLATKTIEETNRVLASGKQTIFFHNRRGYSPIATCDSCRYIPRCSDCDVSLTYHKHIDRLVCHYCGKEYAMPRQCPVCSQPTIHATGYGTERIEDNIASIFPQSGVLRMDLDTTRNKDNYAEIIDSFSEGKADILVGTQMVTKGLDFGNVEQVVVLNADTIINYPDYRSTERAFNMLEQVSGRAGRRADGPSGKVVIQTYQPDHPVIGFVLGHDYTGFYEHELSERHSFGYPPFVRLVSVYVRHRDEAVCRDAAQWLARSLTEKLGNRVMGPHQPPVSRIKSLYIQCIMVKIEAGVSVSRVKSVIRETAGMLKAQQAFRSVDVYYDVDPA